ncbi:DUF6597 domain-containing transcriptional factor [Pedobacter sp. NJ-S-72]
MIAYKEFLPVPELRDRIECYWKFTVGADLTTPLLHVFPPEGCCNLLFVSSAERRFMLFAGPSTVVREITIQPGTVFFGIRIKGGALNGCILLIFCLAKTRVFLYPL